MCGCGISEPCSGCACGCGHTFENTIAIAYERQKRWADLWKSAYERFERVYELHKPHTFMPGEAAFIDDEPEVHCWHCVTEIQNWYPGEPYPCPTIKALDGEQA